MRVEINGRSLQRWHPIQAYAQIMEHRVYLLNDWGLDLYINFTLKLDGIAQNISKQPPTVSGMIFAILKLENGYFSRSGRSLADAVYTAG